MAVAEHRRNGHQLNLDFDCSHDFPVNPNMQSNMFHMFSVYRALPSFSALAVSVAAIKRCDDCTAEAAGGQSLRCTSNFRSCSDSECVSEPRAVIGRRSAQMYTGCIQLVCAPHRPMRPWVVAGSLFSNWFQILSASVWRFKVFGSPNTAEYRGYEELFSHVSNWNSRLESSGRVSQHDRTLWNPKTNNASPLNFIDCRGSDKRLFAYL